MAGGIGKVIKIQMLGVWAVVGFVAVLLLGCQLVTEDEEKVLTILYWQAPSVPSSYHSSGTKDVDAAAIALEPLARYDPDGNIVPVLASAVPTLENGGVSEDLMSITWSLKKRLKWSDGSELTAEDVVFTWVYCTAPDTGCTAQSSFDGISDVEAIDSETVRVTFDAPTPYPYTAFVGSGTPIISEEQFGDCLAAGSSCDQKLNPIGSGPYRVVRFTANKEAVYERNSEFRGEEPYFDRIVLKGGGDALSTARSVLETAEADYAWNLQIGPDELKRLQDIGNGTVVTAFSSSVERVMLNQTNPDPSLDDDRSEYLNGNNPHPFLSNEDIRMAMSLALDRKEIAEELYGFAGKPSCNLIVGPPNYVSSANDGCLTQDIGEANRLLDDVGAFDSDGNGTREFDGIPLKVVFQTSTNDVRQATQAKIKGWWGQIGIEVEIIHHDASLFFGGDPVEDAESSYRRFFADVQMYTRGSGIDPQAYLSNAICDRIPTRDNNWSLSNLARACDSAYDEVYEDLSQMPIGEGRDDLVKQMHDMYIQSYVEIPLVNRGSVSAHLDTLKGVQMNAWDSEMWNIAEWKR